MDGGLGLTQQSKGAGRALLHPLVQGRGLDNGQNRRQRTVRRVGVRGMLVWLVLVLRMFVGATLMLVGDMRMLRMAVVRVLTAVGVRWLGGRRHVGRQHVHFGCGQPPAGHLAQAKLRAHIERGRGLRQGGKGNACIDKGAQQHVAADARKTLQITNSHRDVILTCRPGGILYAPRRVSTSTGKTAFIEPVRKPAQSRVTYWKPLRLRAAVIWSSISIESARGNSSRAISTRASSP